MQNKVTYITLPHDFEAEQHVIGSMLATFTGVNQGCAELKEDDFYDEKHRDIFLAIFEIYAQDGLVDSYVVGRVLRDRGKDYTYYLTQLHEFGILSYAVDNSITRVKEKSVLRRAILACRAIETKALAKDADAEEVMHDAATEIYKIGSGKKATETTFKELLTGAKTDSNRSLLQEVEHRQELYLERKKKGAACTGIPTGLMDLDKVLNGLCNTHLIIVAARPGMGKSAFAMQIATHATITQDITVGVFSLEMSAEQLAFRIISSLSSIDSNKINNGSLNSEDFLAIADAVADYQDKIKMVYEESGYLTVNDIRFIAKRWKEVHDVKLIVIDYLQLISSPKGKYENRVQEVSEISRTLKIMAKELDIPIVCLSQLSRKTEARSGSRPILSDLRDSGAIEQDADSVLLLYRADYYGDKDADPSQIGICEVIVAKNRHGECKTIKTIYQKEIGKFLNYTPIEKEVEKLFVPDSEPDAFRPFS